MGGLVICWFWTALHFSSFRAERPEGAARNLISIQLFILAFNLLTFNLLTFNLLTFNLLTFDL